MGTRYVNSGGVAVELGGGGALSDQYPGSLLADRVDTATSVRTALTATGNATPFADGAYTEIDPSLSADAAGVYVFMSGLSGLDTNSSTVLEFATGAGGAETFWGALQVGWVSGVVNAYVPGFIAAGTRMAVRVRSAVANQATGNMFMAFLPATKSVDPGAPVVMGYNSGTAAGVALTAPGSLNTKGAWTEIEDSTPSDLGVLLVCPDAAGDTNLSSTGILVDIGIGAASAETVLVADVYLAPSTSENMIYRSPTTYGVDIPAGSRLSARYARANANNSLGLFLVGA
jgi:hypothetical protein